MMSKRIRQKRLELGLTQEELANKLGLQKSAIAKYENGRVTNIKRGTIQLMSDLFQVSPSWLMGLSEDSSEAMIKGSIRAEEDLAHIKKYYLLSHEKRQIVDNLIDQLLELPEDQ